MIYRAAVCPGAPLLIPGLADRLRAEVPELIDACDRAVRSLRAADRILLLSCGPRHRDEGVRAQHVCVVHPADATVSSALLTGTSVPPHFVRRLDGGPAGPASITCTQPPAGVGVVVGVALLARAGIDVPVSAVELADGTPHQDDDDHTAAAATVLADARTSADRVGLLVVAEGSASHGTASPGGGSVAAEQWDASLAAALDAGDPAALSRAAVLDPVEAAEILFTSGPALRALAELTTARPPDRAELLLAAAPLGVGYLVATWTWTWTRAGRP